MKRIVLMALVLGGCTESGLYDSKRSPIEANRVSLRGQVCTEDPEEAKFPVRLVVVADQAIGPLFGKFDPSALRIDRLSALIRSAIQRPEYSIAIVGYAGRAQKLAPMEGSFGRAVGDLLNGIQRLILPSPPLGDSKRDYVEGLRVARNLIEDDLVATSAGVRGLTQYVVILVNSGPQDPIARRKDCCAPGDVACNGGQNPASPECQIQVDAGIVEGLREAIAAQGGGGLEFHIMHLAAENNNVNEQVARSHERMAFVGGGRYALADKASGIDFKRLRLFDRANTLKYKFFLATNRMALPTANGIVMDSDGDGLSDLEEDPNEDGTLDADETDPQSSDTDEDGISDLVERLTGLDPRVPNMPEPCEDLLPGDDDRDALTNCDEALLGTEPSLVDSDGDGVPDGLEVTFGTDYLNHDSVEDDDGDGVPNGEELRDHTDPRTTDLQARLGSSYRYDVEDLGTIVEPVVETPRTTLGITVTGAGMGSTPGVGRLFFERSPPEGGTPMLGWQDAADNEPGPLVPIEAETGQYLLASSSYAPVQGEAGRFIRVEVSRPELPDQPNIEPLRLVFRKRQCIRYTVRNIRLMGTESGDNDIRLYFGQAPAARIEAPGPFRLASVPINFVPPASRVPDGAILEVLDTEYVRYPQMSFSGQ